MQIRVNKGRVTVTPNKQELKLLSDAYDFAATMPKGMGFDDELDRAEDSLLALLEAMKPVEEAPKE